MADTKITALSELNETPDGSDLIAIVDVSDTGSGAAQGAGGKTKRITRTNLVAGLSSDTHTHDDATTSASGHMSAADKTKLDGVATGAEVNVNADWNSSSGDSQILNKPSTFTPESHTHSVSDVTNLQTTLDGKQATITGAATSIDTEDLTSSRAVVSDASGKVAVSDVTSTELGYLDGATSNIQTQIDGKAASSHAHGLNDLSDVSTAGAADGKIIKHNGTSWVIADDSGGSGSSGTVTSVAVSGSDGIDVDSGSPVTTSGTIALGLSNVPDAAISSAATWNAKQDALTHGIANTNTVKVDAADVADDDFARFTATGLEGRSASEVLSDIGASASSHNHSGVYEPADATILKDADIGSTVQGYDADTAKTDTAQTFTAPQRSTFYTSYADDTATFYMNTAQNWTWTVTASGASSVTFELESGTSALTNANGQSGYILLTNSAGTITLNATTTDVDTDLLTTISGATGTFLLSYICDGSKVYLTNSKALT